VMSHFVPLPKCLSDSNLVMSAVQLFMVDSAAVEESCTSPFQRASLLAARAPHSGDCIFCRSLPVGQGFI